MIPKYFFFAILFIASIAAAFASIPAVFADEPVSSTRYRTYQLEKFSDGTERQTLGLVPYVWDGSKFVDRIIQNNSTHFNVYSEMGSFSFSKSSCTITQYVQGFDPTVQVAHDSDIVIKDWFWTIARKNGTNPWEVIDPMIFGCSINTFQNATGKYLEMTRTHQSTGSYLKVTLAAKTDMPVEDYTELYMNVPAWSGNKFAFVLWAKDVNTDSLTYRNGTTIQIPQGITTIDRSQLTVESMNFIKNGNAFFFDWQKAAGKFKTLLLNKTGTNLDVQFGFNNNAIPLSSGQKMYLDPTYGYTAGTHKSPESAVGNCATNNGGNAAGIVGTDGAANFCYYDSLEWDTSSIPDGSTITDVLTRYDTAVGGGAGPITCNAVQVPSQPSTITNAVLQADIIASATTYASLGCTTGMATDTVVDLGATADADVQSRLAADWFAYGIIRSPNALAAIIYADFDTVELQVTYAIGPPDAITTLQVDDYDADSVDLSWTAPGLNGWTLQLYQMNYTTPCGTPLTQLPNGTTATSYTVSGLTGATCYSFRATAVTQNGGNITGANIVNVTTLSFNEANYTIGSFNFQATNPNIFPIRYERIDSGTQTLVNVTFTNSFNMACDLRYTYAQTNQTYYSISSIPVSASEDEASFNFLNSTNDIVTFHCWNQAGNQSANYVMTQTDFLLKQQVRDFRNGTYGTMGQFGAFDFITLIVVIIAMIGLNHKTEAVGGFFAIIAVAVLAYFEIVAWYTAIIAGLAVIILLAISSTRKD